MPNNQENPAGCPAGPSPLNPDSDGDGVNDAQDTSPCNVTQSAGGTLGATGALDRVRFRAKCPRDADFRRCKVRSVGRLGGRHGPRVTQTFRTKVPRGKSKIIFLEIFAPFRAETRAAGRITVVRKVKSGPGQKKTRLLSRPVLF